MSETLGVVAAVLLLANAGFQVALALGAPHQVRNVAGIAGQRRRPHGRLDAIGHGARVIGHGGLRGRRVGLTQAGVVRRHHGPVGAHGRHEHAEVAARHRVRRQADHGRFRLGDSGGPRCQHVDLPEPPLDVLPVEVNGLPGVGRRGGE